MSLIKLDQNGQIPQMQITEVKGQSYAYEVFIRKVINGAVRELAHIRSRDLPNPILPFPLRHTPDELQDARIIWFVFIFSPTDDDSIDPYKIDIKFTQDQRILTPDPDDPPPPHEGALTKGVAHVIGDVFVFSG